MGGGGRARTYRQIGENTTVPDAWLSKGQRLGRAVAFIPRGESPATGFLLADDLLLTNNHVFPTAGDAVGLVARFNYREGIDGRRLRTHDYELDPAGYFHTNPALDYTIVGVSGDPGRKWRHIDLQPDPPELKPGDDIFVIGYPNGEPRSISASGNVVTEVDGHSLRYTADTDIGSSGSPVFDHEWRLVALHHWGDETFNAGILSSAIAADRPGR